MKYTNTMVFIVLLLSSNAGLLGFKFPDFTKVTELFKKNKAEKIIEKEYPIKKIDTLEVANIDGDITVTGEWEQPIVRVKATIKAGKEEDLELVTINCAHHRTSLSLSTNTPEDKVYQVHYELMIPKKINLAFTTQKGNMSIAESSGKVHAQTFKGDINIERSKSSINAETLCRGHIAINDAQGPVVARAKKGSISIANASNSISAHTENGIVRTAHSSIPHTSNINLESEYGNAIVSLPASTNANLYAKTDHGCITSDHFVTLKSQTTKLDPKSWSRFKKEVDGTIGAGGASIQINCKNGTIKLLDNSVTS